MPQAAEKPPEQSPTSSPAGDTGVTRVTSGVAPAPDHLTPQQYTSAAFLQQQLKSCGQPWQVYSHLQPAQKLAVVLGTFIDVTPGVTPTAAAAASVTARWQLLLEGDVAVAAVSVDILVGLLSEWMEAGEEGWEGVVVVAVGGDKMSAAHEQVVAWATSHWDDMTYDQAVAVYELLCSRSVQEVPVWVERGFMKALVCKTLTKAAAAANAAAAGGSGVGVNVGGSVEVAGGRGGNELQQQVEEQQLKEVLELCERLGGKADWIRWVGGGEGTWRGVWRGGAGGGGGEAAWGRLPGTGGSLRVRGWERASKLAGERSW